MEQLSQSVENMLQDLKCLKEVFSTVPVGRGKENVDDSLRTFISDIEKVIQKALSNIDTLKRENREEMLEALLREKRNTFPKSSNIPLLDSEELPPQVKVILQEIMKERKLREGTKLRKILEILLLRLVMYGPKAEPVNLEEYRDYLGIPKTALTRTYLANVRTVLNGTSYRLQSVPSFDGTKKITKFRLARVTDDSPQ